MAKPYLSILRKAYKAGHKIRILFDDWGPDLQYIIPKNYTAAKKEVEAWDGGADFEIINKAGDGIGMVWTAIGYGNEDEETVVDYTMTPFLLEWEKEFGWS